MNWFEPVFAGIIGQATLAAEAWAIIAAMMVGGLLTPLLGFAGFQARALSAAAGVLVLQVLDPFGAQTAMVLVLLLFAVGTAGILRGCLRGPRLALLPGSIAALVAAVLAYGYHMVLVNGLDSENRRLQAAQLESYLTLEPDVLAALCASPAHVCGEGRANTGYAEFDRELSDWFDAAPRGWRGFVSGSNGAITTPETFVWAAHFHDDGIRWIAQSYQGHTDALEATFFLFLIASVSFWAPAGILVEVLHLRARRARTATSNAKRVHEQA